MLVTKKVEWARAQSTYSEKSEAWRPQKKSRIRLFDDYLGPVP